MGSHKKALLLGDHVAKLVDVETVFAGCETRHLADEADACLVARFR